MSGRKIQNSRFSILSRTIFKYFVIGKIQEFVRKRNFTIEFSNLFLNIVINKIIFSGSVEIDLICAPVKKRKYLGKNFLELLNIK